MALEIKKAENSTDYALIEKMAKTIWNEYYISILEKEIKELKVKKQEFSDMITGIAEAIAYLESAKKELGGIRVLLKSALVAHNAEGYARQIEAYEGESEQNITKLKNVSELAGDKLEEIEKNIKEKTSKKITLNNRLAYWQRQ